LPVSSFKKGAAIHTVGESAEDPVIVLPGCVLLAEIFPEIIVTCVSTTF
jgi:hypothetical protein